MIKTIHLKKIAVAIIACFSLAAHAQSTDVWVSDEIEAPLRDKPEINAKIVTLLRAGQKAIMLEKNKEYVKIKTADNTVGWLSNYYVLKKESVHAQLQPMKEKLTEAEQKIIMLTQELNNEKGKINHLENSKATLEKSANEVAQQAKANAGSAQKLANDNELLKKKLAEQSEKMTELAKALNVTKEKASKARTDYLSLVKVSENAMEIDKQNRRLQENAVQSETQIQQLKNELQTLKAKLDTRQTIFVALLIFGGILAGYVLSVLTPPRGRRRSSSYASF